MHPRFLTTPSARWRSIGDGNIAAATSTGGTLNKAPGRLGDSSLIGCGCYADNQTAAASTTGWGEPIMKLVLAKWAADRVATGSLPEWVAAEAINYLKDRVNGHGGMILLDAAGRFGIAHNTPRMAWALKTSKTGFTAVARTSQGRFVNDRQHSVDQFSLVRILRCAY